MVKLYIINVLKFPNLINNRWCKWLLSGENGFLPLDTLTINNLTMSRPGTINSKNILSI